MLCYEYHNVLTSKQRILNFIAVVAMATPEAGSSTRVPQAAKRPTKTETFSKSLRVALSIFDDEVTTLSDVCETAYENFIVAYKTAFTDIWPKIDGADIEVILDSVKDTELHQLRCMADILSPAEEQPKLVEEQRSVPTQTISSGAWSAASQNRNLQINKPAHLYLTSSKILQKLTNITQPPRRI